MAESFGLQKKKSVVFRLPTIAKPHSSVQPSWSELQADVLELILKRLAVIDIIRFKAVCNSWNIAASFYVSSPLYSPLPQTPWLMFHCNKQRNCSLGFFSLTENKPYMIEKEQENDLVLWSSHGWLVNFDVERKALYLLNPFSSSEGKIQLPWMDYNAAGWTIFSSVVLSSGPSRSKNFSIAILNCLPPQRLSFWYHGNTKWTRIILADQFYEDVICHNGEIYAFSRVTNTVEVWDFHGVSPKQIFDIESVPLTLRNQWEVPEEMEDSVKSRIRLVKSLLGEILFVEIVFSLEPTFLIIGFNVSKLNLNERRWMPLQSLPDQAILADDYKAVSVSTRDFPEFEENSIYFEDDNDLRVYNLKENKVVKSYSCERWMTDYEHSLWVVPTLSPW